MSLKNSKPFDDELVYCVKCPDKGRSSENFSTIRKNEIEKEQWNNWTCSRCRSDEIGLQLIDFIKTRINVTATEDEDRSKFIFRELLQNADDVGANILVLNFCEDALYVANDGRAFSTTSTDEKLSDFERISRILGRHQAEDKETVGHFGSGFQTVYAITNSPEVHSHGTSSIMNPSLKKWKDAIPKRKSPYLHKAKKGVLFRLPWRDDERANEEYDGVKVFENPNDWPRWSHDERRDFYENLREYLHHAILCCKNLQVIRIIWLDKDKHEGYQASRDYSLRINDNKDSDIHISYGSIEAGKISPKKTDVAWEENFHINAWGWIEHTKYSYLIGSKNLTNRNGDRVHIGKTKSGIVSITTKLHTLDKELKRGDCHVLLPLFNTVTSFPESEGRYYLYSVIPLPRRSLNKFAFSAHFFPTEDRKDVDVEGPTEVYREWYQTIMKNMMFIYKQIIPIYLDRIKVSYLDKTIAEKLILNVMLNAELPEWMRPGREKLEGWWEDDFIDLINALISHPMIVSNDEWVIPNTSYWATNEDEEKVLRILGCSTFSSEFMNHAHFKNVLSTYLERQKVNPMVFNNIWSDFIKGNCDEFSKLHYKSVLNDGQILNKGAINCLIKYCITRKGARAEDVYKSIIPGKDGVLRSIEDYSIIPIILKSMLEIMSDSMIIHDDFNISELENVSFGTRELDSHDIVKVLDEIVSLNPERYNNLSDLDHQIFSDIIITLINEMDFSLNESMKTLRFIPYRRGDIKSVGTPNTQITQGKETLARSRPENYQRDSIFGIQKIPVPGLTDEVNDNIKYLSLVSDDEDTLSRVEETLHLIKLMFLADTPVNYIRHFLSPLHGSLFVDEILSEYLGIGDEESRIGQKKIFLDAIKSYFITEKTEIPLRPRDMAEVPCLYDENENWYKAKDFALALYPELEIIGYKALHPELAKWPNDTLLALGVREFAESSRIIDTIKNLWVNRVINRKKLSNILLWLLTSDTPIDTSFIMINNYEWIPTMDGGYHAPSNSLVPTKENLSIVGKKYPLLLDFNSCSDNIKQRALERRNEKEIEIERYEKLSIRKNPSFDDMFSIVEDYYEDAVPPSKLFEAFDRLLEDEDYDVGDEPLGYYYEGQWILADKIFVIDEKVLPNELKDEYIVLPPNNKHRNYLEYAGAKFKLHINDILDSIVDKKVNPTLELWDKIREIKDNIDEDISDKYCEKQIYPIGKILFEPSKIIYKNNLEKSFLESGRYGDYYVLSSHNLKRHGAVLKILGAKLDVELTREDIIKIMESYKNEGNILNENNSKMILNIIKELYSRDMYEPFPNKKLWPAKKAGVYEWMNPKDCYVKDSFLAKYFENDVYLLLSDVENDHENLIEYGVLSKAKSVSDNINIVKNQSIGEAVLSTNKTLIINELSKALKLFYARSNIDSSVFDWLSNAKIKMCDEVVTVYSLNEINQEVSNHSMIYVDDGKYTAYMQTTSLKAYDQLTKDIINICIDKGLPESSKLINDLTFLIYKLITSSPYFWGDVIEGYEYLEDIPVHPFVETEEGGKGYLSTKLQLHQWYECCQICRNQTPGDEHGYETMERVKRIVTKIGGRYKGTRLNYTEGNSLFLCPRHHTLFLRGLVKFPGFEDINNKEDMEPFIEKIEERIRTYNTLLKENLDKYASWDCEVFEGQLKGDEREIKPRWYKRKITFTNEHVVGFLENMLNYLKENHEKYG